jgi:hypothetical protein
VDPSEDGHDEHSADGDYLVRLLKPDEGSEAVEELARFVAQQGGGTSVELCRRILRRLSLLGP